MKSYFIVGLAAATLLLPHPAVRAATAPAASFVYETTREFFGSADFDGDTSVDVVIVDKETGKYRLGYGQASGLYNWVDNRPSGIKGISALSIGKVLNGKEALVVTGPDANALSMVDASSSTAPSRPVTIAFEEALGPSSVIAVDIGGEGNTPVLDLYVGSIYNSPDPNLFTLLRNGGQEFPKIAEGVLPGVLAKGNRVGFKPGQPEFACYVLNGDDGVSFRVEDASSGKPAAVATVTGLPAGTEYAAGSFRGTSQPEFIFYKPGEKSITVRPVEEVSAGKYQLAAGASFDLGEPVRRVVTLNSAPKQRLFVVFGEGQKATIYNFDGKSAPAEVQSLSTTNEYTSAVANEKTLVVFSQAAGGKFSTRYETFTAGETYAPGPYGALPSLADNDNITIPEIHGRIVSALQEKSEGDMKLYTNTIPGTRVTYSMVPIRGGEFLMGSPEGESDRKPDEGPQIKVKVSPFWMGQFEITWNEYELFMYPDEEKRTRAILPTDSAGDKLADAVSHPSKPYVEMSFGMGKEGYPAISMTQHAANKYCQWLSAKTGHFYRLPTEAEWEYACRAGTTGKHFFGDDESKLAEYGWYEQNSDFKYQKVGKKKPNPWGLYDIYGNVVEWVLDQYDAGWYSANAAKGVVIDPWNKATKPYPHAVRGGSWDDEAKMLRSAARRGSDRAWKMQDPQLPKSVWYFSDAQWVGFRLVRPLKVPPPEEMQKYWTSGVERD